MVTVIPQGLPQGQLSTKGKRRKSSKKQTDHAVKDPTTAIKFLIDGDFKSEDDEMSFELRGVIAMQSSQQTRNPKMVSEAFKALSYLIFDTHQKNTVANITKNIAKAVSTATKRIWVMGQTFGSYRTARSGHH